MSSIHCGIFSLVPRRSRLGSTVSCDVTERERTPKQCGGLLLVLLIPYPQLSRLLFHQGGKHSSFRELRLFEPRVVLLFSDNQSDLQGNILNCHQGNYPGCSRGRGTCVTPAQVAAKKTEPLRTFELFRNDFPSSNVRPMEGDSLSRFSFPIAFAPATLVRKI